MAMSSSLTSTLDMFGCQDRILRCPLGPDKVVPAKGFAETLFEGLKRSAERPALVDVSKDRNITFEEFLHDVELIARHLVTDIGVKSGDVVAIFAPNSIEWMQLASAILRTGAVLAAVNHLLTPDELRYQLSLCGATVLYTVQPLASVAQEAATGSSIQTIIINELSPEKCDGPADVTLVNWSQLLSNDTTAGIELSQISLPDPSTLGIRPRDPAMILFSSGTTGPQKAVVLSHRNILTQMEISCDKRIKKIRNNEIMFAPFAHIKGCLFTLYNLAFGYTTYIMSRFNLSTYLSLVAANKLDCLSIVPAIAVQLAKSPEIKKHDFSHVKEIVCGTAPLRHEVEELLRERFPGVLLRQAYGLTETASIVTSVPDELDEGFARTKTASVGVPLYNVQIKITDLATGEALGPNEEGEICIKSPTVMVGYAGNVKATAEAIDRNGWLHTGDVGRYDDDKFLWIVDRIKELIKYKSYQVAPAELEAILLSHPAVADAGVVGLPDVMAGELPTAMVVRHANSTEAISEKELMNYVSERVAPHKLLRGGIRFVDVIPRSPTGKILRRQMRDLLTKSRL